MPAYGIAGSAVATLIAQTVALAGLVGSQDNTELSFQGGHSGIYVSSRAQREVPASIHRWLLERQC